MKTLWSILVLTFTFGVSAVDNPMLVNLLNAKKKVVASGGAGGSSSLVTNISVYLRMDNTATAFTNAAQNGVNDMSWIGGVLNTNGVAGQAGRFPYTAYTQVADNAGISSSTPEFTWAAWFQLLQSQTWGAIYNKDLETSLYCFSDVPQFRVDDSTAGNSIAEWGGAVSIGVWHCAIGWYDSGDKKAYIQIDNGTPVAASLALANGPKDAGAALNLAANAFDFARIAIDEFARWPFKLNSTQRSNYWAYTSNGVSYPFTGLP